MMIHFATWQWLDFNKRRKRWWYTLPYGAVWIFTKEEKHDDTLCHILSWNSVNLHTEQNNRHSLSHVFLNLKKNQLSTYTKISLAHPHSHPLSCTQTHMCTHAHRVSSSGNLIVHFLSRAKLQTWLGPGEGTQADDKNIEQNYPSTNDSLHSLVPCWNMPWTSATVFSMMALNEGNMADLNVSVYACCICW